MISTHGYVAAQPPLGAADTGGQVVYVLELAKSLARLGYQVDVWTRRFEEQPEIEPVSDGVRIIRIPCGGPNFIPKEYLYESLGEWVDGALEFVRRHQLEYLLVNSHYWDAGVAGEGFARGVDAPHVHTPHSLGRWKEQQMKTDFPHGAEQMERRYNFAVRIREEQRLYASCAQVVATTPVQAEYLAEAYNLDPERICMVPAGYDEVRFRPASASVRRRLRERLGFTGHAVLALGRLARNKGYDLLIEAFAVLATRDPEAQLYLAIGGEQLMPHEETLLAELRALADKTGFAERIHFRSFVKTEDLADTYRAADLFVLCSRYEPFGMTAIESMAAGTATVVTVHGGLHRSLSCAQHAFFADPMDREELGLTMWQAFRYPELRQRVARAGAARARRLFTWSGIARDFLRMTLDNTPVDVEPEAPQPAKAC